MCLLFITFSAATFGQEKRNSRAQVLERVRGLESVGRRMFFDPSLSASGKMSCASCHNPAFAYGPPNVLSVQLGGKSGQESGIRAVPSLRYLQAVPQFSEHKFEEETNGDDSVDNGPTGGLTWDGRVDRGRQQAQIPLLSHDEMANESEDHVVEAVLKAPYSAQIEKLSAGRSPNRVFETVLEAFETWEQNYAEFYPYDSKYDAWLAGKAKLSKAELRGLRLFTNPEEGNCARCHTATRGVNGTPPQFTDYSLVALGVPRNSSIPANADPSWYDLGMCGPKRTDLLHRDEYCGRFMTPTLRNVATRNVFFHNGAIHSLREAVAFYVDRDTNAKSFGDLPLQYRTNVDMDAPFGRPRVRPPVLSDQEIDDVVSFLRTLTDHFNSDR